MGKQQNVNKSVSAPATPKKVSNGVKLAEDSDTDSEAETVVHRKLGEIYGRSKLKEKLLDRLAELLSRQKTAPCARAVHIAATSLTEQGAGATIDVAKNGGLDKVDVDMLRLLQI